jgi:hypothetical protein
MPPAHISCVDDLSGAWALVSAASISAIVALIVLLIDFRSTSLRRLLIACAGISALVALVLTWQQYRAPVQAQRVAFLRAFGSEADDLLEGLTAEPGTDSSTYRARADDFSGRLEKWVALNIGPRALDTVRHHDPKDVNIRLENETDNERASSITQIIQTKGKIAELVDAKASDECIKPTTTSEHAFPPSLD